MVQRLLRLAHKDLIGNRLLGGLPGGGGNAEESEKDY
jgi:hypothetical protein